MSALHRLDPGAIVADLRARLDWREESVSLALIVAESAIVYLFLGVLLPELRAPYAAFPGWLILVLLLLAHLLPHWLDELLVWSPHYEIALALGLVASLLLALKVAAFPQQPWFSLAWLSGSLDGLILRPNSAVRPPWAIVGVLLYVWWRGRTRGEPALETTYRMLRWGTVALISGLLLILVATEPGAPVRAGMGSAVILYFVAALGAVGMARFRIEGLRTGNPLGPPWLATFALPIGVIVVVAVLLAALFSRRFLDTVLLLVGPLLLIIEFVIRAVVLVIALLTFIVIAPILWLLERQGFGDFAFFERLPRASGPLEQLDRFARESLHVADPARYLIAGIILLLLGSMLIRYAYRRRRRWRAPVAEQRESVFAWPEAVVTVTAPWRWLFRGGGAADASLERLRADPRWAYTVAIRETYIRLLRRAARAGVPRPPEATPGEYRATLSAQFPEADDAVATITAHYTAARYRRDPATADEAAAVQHAWVQFQSQPPRSHG